MRKEEKEIGVRKMGHVVKIAPMLLVIMTGVVVGMVHAEEDPSPIFVSYPSLITGRTVVEEAGIRLDMQLDPKERLGVAVWHPVDPPPGFNLYYVYLKLAPGKGEQTFDYAHTYLDIYTFTPADGVRAPESKKFGEDKNAWAELYRDITVDDTIADTQDLIENHALGYFDVGDVGSTIQNVWKQRTGIESNMPDLGFFGWNAGNAVSEIPAGFAMFLLGALGTGLVWFRKKLTR